MTSNFDRFIRNHLRVLREYEPIEPSDVLAKQLGISSEKIIKLNGNENPYGPSPRVKIALQSYSNYHVYPDPLQHAVREALASYTGLDPSSIVVGAGCDELIDLLLRLTLETSDNVIDCVPTFGMYAFCTRVCGGTVIPVQRSPDFQVDLVAVREAIDEHTKAIFLCSPNNPTGALVPEATVQELLKEDLLVVVDETYYEFSGHTFASWIPKYENLVVLRSMSKWAGLASLRIGYGLMNPELVSHLLTIKSPYNISAAAQLALIASLDDRSTLFGRVEDIIEERQRLYIRLQAMQRLQVIASEGNFLLCGIVGMPAVEVYRGLMARGIVGRHFDNPRLQDYLRISIGKPEENDAVVQAFDEILRE